MANFEKTLPLEAQKTIEEIEAFYLKLNEIERDILRIVYNRPLSSTYQVKLYSYLGILAVEVPSSKLEEFKLTEKHIQNNPTIWEKNAKKIARDREIHLPSQNKITYALNKLVFLKVLDEIQDMAGTKSRIKYSMNPEFYQKFKQAGRAFYKKIELGLVNPLATTKLEREIFEFYPEEYFAKLKKSVS